MLVMNQIIYHHTHFQTMNDRTLQQ